MFTDALGWYSDHAATIFVCLISSAIGMERLRRSASGRFDATVMFGTFEPERASVRFGIGSKRIDTPVGALVGGYPALVTEMRAIIGWPCRLRYALAPPA